MEIVEVPIGTDRVAAQVIADTCRAEGLRGELVVFDETRYELGSAARVPHRFVVRAEDEAAVHRILGDLFPDIALSQMRDPAVEPLTARRLAVKGAIIIAAVACLIVVVLLLAAW